MPLRTQRADEASTFPRWVDELVLPVVTALLVIGAVFVFSAWTAADGAERSARRLDDARAARLAGSIDGALVRRKQDLASWARAQRTLLVPGREAQLRAALDAQVGESASSSAAAWLVVRADGSVPAAAEAHPGQVAASGITDDLRALGRQAAAREEPVVGGRLKLGDEHAFAIAVPMPHVEGTPVDAALVAVTWIERSTIGSFLKAEQDDAVDEAMLVDARGHTLVGHAQPDGGGDLVRRPVGDSGWTVAFEREPIDSLLPAWAYPAFAALLILAAIAFGVQEHRRRRLRRDADDRAATVQELYELASRALHAESMEEQAEALAHAAVDLVGVDAARVTITAADEPFERAVGDGAGAFHEHAVAILGPRGDLGSLAVWSTEPLDDRSRWILETAAALVGAGVETLVLLERERGVASELQRLDELRSNLLATVSHELLSPLTAVKGVLGLLSMQDDLGERGREYVDVATDRTDRLVALIRDLFDCSLLETGRLDIRPRRQRADELLESALGAQAAARPGELRLSATPNLHITVDPVRFDQLVNNLVTNAFRHGAPPVEVAVRPGEGGTYVMVSDEGSGIPPEQRDEVFGKFWQGSGGHAREVEGAGLGLSLVQGLVRVHGGDITIDSTHADGRGARFIAFFPDEVSGAEQPVDAAPSTPTLA
jgi:signal transduction histidine kinase